MPRDDCRARRLAGAAAGRRSAVAGTAANRGDREEGGVRPGAQNVDVDGASRSRDRTLSTPRVQNGEPARRDAPELDVVRVSDAVVGGDDRDVDGLRSEPSGRRRGLLDARREVRGAGGDAPPAPAPLPDGGDDERVAAARARLDPQLEAAARLAASCSPTSRGRRASPRATSAPRRQRVADQQRRDARPVLDDGRHVAVAVVRRLHVDAPVAEPDVRRPAAAARRAPAA